MDKILFMISFVLVLLISLDVADLYFSERELEKPIKHLTLKKYLICCLVGFPLVLIAGAPYAPMLSYWFNRHYYFLIVLIAVILMFVDLLIIFIMGVVARLRKKERVIENDRPTKSSS